MVKDFNFQPLTNEIKPIFMTIDGNNSRARLNYLLIKIKSQNVSASVVFIEKLWKEIQPDNLYLP